MLATILNYHIVASNVPTTSMENEMVLKTGFGIDEDNTSAAATLTVQRKGTAIVIAGNEGVTSTIAKENRLAKNGLVHLMDTVLVPGSLPATLPQIPIGSDTSSPGNDNNNAGGVDSSSTNVGGTSGADTTSITRPLVVATIVAATTSMVWAL